MGKKGKIGKDRKDKFYKLAKETGFRSRAAFKLIQLNRKFGFLQESQVCIDLCAAPGGWMQVAKQNMPVSSIVVGVDLFPIRAIPGCISLVEDITTEKCKASLTKELQSWKADVVLHDGAPNVGKNWLFDAYQQICLTLQSVKLATHFLRKGGWFVTKVFRSKDYNALLWVLKQLFRKVHATKPSASRKESAEIFVVCQGYIAPDKIDPKFLDVKYVFEELDLESSKPVSILNADKKKRIKAEGYTEEDFSTRHELLASEFIQNANGLNALQGVAEIVIDTEEIKSHPKTTSEIHELCKDIKVLGRKDLRVLLNWWKQLRATMFPKSEVKEEEIDTEEKEPLTEEQVEDMEFEELEKHIADIELEQNKDDKRKKKKVQKARSKLNQQLNLKMVIKGDSGPTEEDIEVFRLSQISNQNQLDALQDQAPDMVLDEADNSNNEFKPKYVSYAKDGEYLNRHGQFKDSDEDSTTMDESSEDEEEDFNTSKGLGFSDEEEDSDLDTTHLKEKKKAMKNSKKEKNPLITDLDTRDKDAKRQHRVQLWFENDKLKDIENEVDEDIDLNKLSADYKQRGVKVLGEDRDESEVYLGKKARRRQRHKDEMNASSSSDSSDSELEDEIPAKTNGTAAGGPNPPKKKYKLDEEELALGTMMVKSKKLKRDLVDAAWNRYTFNDENLPEWFVQDEAMNMRREAPVPKELVSEYRARMEEVNVRSIKKVMEAKSRKKKRSMKRLAKAKRKAESILENADASNQEKMRQLKKLYKKASDEKKEITYVVAKKHQTGKRARRPPGVKGQFRVVDRRLKKDKRAVKAKNKRKK